MHYTQSIEYCLTGSLNEKGLEQRHLDDACEKVEQARVRLVADISAGQLPAFSIAQATDDLPGFEPYKDDFLRGMTDVFVLGTGGSSLGAQALAQLTGWRIPGSVQVGSPGKPRFHFFDNLDPKSFELTLRTHDLKTVAVLVVSKSGGTGETIMQLLCVLDAFHKAELDWNLSHHILAITMPEEGGERNSQNALRNLCALHDIPMLDHHPGIGGRFSVLSNVGLLPAALMGLDTAKIRKGAAYVLEETLSAEHARDAKPSLGAAVQLAMAEHHDRSISVLLSYSDRLKSFGEWFIQLWAESLGKGQKGTTPLAALGPVMQHSQLQMFLDGPSDKFFTLIMDQVAKSGPSVPESLAKDPLVGYLSGKKMGDLVDCQQRATAETLAKSGHPVRMMQLEKLDEEVMGALFMHFMIETTLTGFALGVDVFDQPAVEIGKKRAKSYLASM